MALTNTTFTIHADNPFQEMSCIGVKDSTECEDVGRWRDGEQRQRVAQLLFDATLDESGNPTGIGLTGWRFNISDNDRAETAFLRPTWEHYGLEDSRSYDLEAHPGRRWFLYAANRYGIKSITACSSGPPPSLFESPTGHNHVIASTIPSICTRYASFLNSLCLHYHATGIVFSHVSPLRSGYPEVNEVFDHHSLNSFCAKLEEELKASRLPTEIILPDCMSIDWLLRSYRIRTDPSRQTANIRDDFDRYLDLEMGKAGGNCENTSDFLGFFAQSNNQLLKTISAASYLTCFPQGDRLIGTRERLSRVLAGIRQRKAFSFCVSEYSLRLPTGDARIPRELFKSPMAKDTTGIDAALWAARVLCVDLSVSGCSSWFYSEAVSDVNGNGLITIDKNYDPNTDYDGSKYEATKLLWALGQFSFFIQPSMRRVKLTRSDGVVPRDAVEDLLSTAFIKKDRFVVVFVNMSLSSKVVKLRLSGIEGIVEQASLFNTYITSKKSSLSVQRSHSLGELFQVPEKSIFTCRGRIVRSGYLYFIVSINAKGAAIEGCSDANTTISLNPLSQSNPYQLWKIAACHNNQVAIINSVTGFSLTASQRNGFPLFQDVVKEELSPYQMFAATGQPTPDMIIQNTETGMVLEGVGDVVKMVKRTGKAAQRWIIRSFDAPEQDLGHLHGVTAQIKKGPQRRNIKTPSEAELRNPPRHFITDEDPYDMLVEVPKLVDVPTTRPVQISQYGRYKELYSSRRGKEDPEYPTIPVSPQCDEVSSPVAGPLMPTKSVSAMFGTAGRVSASDVRPPSPILSPESAELPSFARQTLGKKPSQVPTTISSPVTQFSPLHPTMDATALPHSHFDDQSLDSSSSSQRPHSPTVFASTRREGELETWRAQNTILKKELQKQQELTLQRQREDEARQKAERIVEEERRKQKEEEEKRAKRRGTSHLILNFAMTRKEFSSKYQGPLRTELARSIGVKPNCVILTYVGEDAKGIKVEVRLQDVDDVGDKLDKLYESVSAPEGNTDHFDDDDVDESSSEGEKEVRNQENRLRRELKTKKDGKRKKKDDKKKSTS